MSPRVIRRFVKGALHRKVTSIDATLGVSSEFLHFIIDTCVGAFFKFLLFTKLATHRQKVPADAAHLARILSTQSVDCGTCVQVAVNLALQDGMRPEHITAALERRPEALPSELRDIYAFTDHIVRHTYEEHELRETLRARYGDGGLVDLAYAIAGAQVFPLTKQVLGFAKSCSKVEVAVPRASEPAAAAPRPAHA